MSQPFLTPPLKFHFASNSCLPAERAGFCFALIFFGYFFVSRQKSNWGLRGNAPEKTRASSAPPTLCPRPANPSCKPCTLILKKKSRFRTQFLRAGPGKTAGPGWCECRKDFCFALIFFTSFLVSRQERKWGFRGNAPVKIRASSAPQSSPP
jgi:hypothetical protein